MTFGFSQTLPMEVQVAGSKGDLRYEGTLFGAVPGRHLIVGGFKTAEFAVGDELVVKTAMDGHVIGFWAKVEKRIDGSDELYLLSYPELIEELNLRKSDRLNVMIPAKVRLTSSKDGASSELQFEGLLLNISDGGCFLSSERDWPDDLECELRFALPGGRDTFVLSGQVVRISKEGERAGNFGVQFGCGAGNTVALKEIQSWISEKLSFLKS